MHLVPKDEWFALRSAAERRAAAHDAKRIERPAMTPTRLTLFAVGMLAICAVSACAVHRSPQIEIDSNVDFGYPDPEAESCGSAKDVGVLDVVVQHERHEAFPGVVVWAIPADNVDERTTAPLAVRTDAHGLARFPVTWGRWAVFVAFSGFGPEAKGVYLKAGCSGRVTVTLRLGDHPLS
jgi:hypothetical protein